MTRAALIGLTIALSAPPFLFAGAVLGWLSRDREDNAELAEMRATCAEAAATCLKADALLANVQANLAAPPAIPEQRYSLHCPECGDVEVCTDLLPVPVTDWDAALEVILIQHSIQAHLADIA